MAKKLINTTTIDHDQWVQIRKNSIGGSDAATIVGLNPYASKFTLWADKMGMSDEIQDNEAMRIGRDLEQYVADRFMEATGKQVRRNNFMFVHDEHEWMSANLDRVIVGENAGLECKTTSLYNKTDFENGEVPLNYYAQCVHYMAAMGFDKMYLAVLVLGKSFHYFEIERKEDEIQNLIQAESDFWHNHIIGKTPPVADGHETTTKTLAQLFPAAAATDDQVMIYDLDSEIERYEKLTADIKVLESEAQDIKNRVVQRLGNASYGIGTGYEITYKPQARSGIDAKLLAEKYPKIAEEVSTKTEFRVMRIKRMKG